MTVLAVNGRARDVDADPATPLLYVLREDLGLVGAKFGCGLGQCGACTVLLDDVPVFSCITPLAAVPPAVDETPSRSLRSQGCG